MKKVAEAADFAKKLIGCKIMQNKPYYRTAGHVQVCLTLPAPYMPYDSLLWATQKDTPQFLCSIPSEQLYTAISSQTVTACISYMNGCVHMGCRSCRHTVSLALFDTDYDGSGGIQQPDAGQAVHEHGAAVVGH